MPTDAQKEKRKISRKAWTEKNKDRLKIYYKDHAARNKGRLQAYRRDHYARNRSEILAKTRAYNIKKNYGLTQAQIDEMFKSQGGLCKICKGLPDVGRWKKLHIDHDHRTGKVRGLICMKCNHGLGSFADSIESLKSAIKYLEESNHV